MSDDQAALRKRALQRAGIAMLAAIVLLLSVLAFEDGEPTGAQVRAPSPVAPLPVPPPVVRAPAPVVLPPASAISDPLVENAQAVIESKIETASIPLAVSSPDKIEKMTGPSLANGYLLQLGVFGAMDNAEGLRSDLAARGVPAHVEGRVVVGPFSSKAEAEAARDRLKREGLNVGIVVPPRKNK